MLGIDPGLANTGFGVVESGAGRLRALDGGVVKTAAGDALELRLAELQKRIELLLAEHKPDSVALEKLFFGRNVSSAQGVSQARGAVLAAAGRAGLACYSYTPQQLKSAVCGSGGAAKEQVQTMVQALLSLPEPPQPDHAADALAAAICHIERAGLASAIRNAA